MYFQNKNVTMETIQKENGVVHMKPHVTTKEEILNQAVAIAKRDGIDKVNIRKLAVACNMAVGSMYNYYPNKEALLTEVSGFFWMELLKDHEKIFRKGMNFTMFLEQYYSFIAGRLKHYDTGWVNDCIGKPFEREAYALLKSVLEQDTRINPSIWNMELTEDAFCRHVMTNLMALLRAGEPNCRFFAFLLEQLLY